MLQWLVADAAFLDDALPLEVLRQRELSVAELGKLQARMLCLVRDLSPRLVRCATSMLDVPPACRLRI